jgi:DNA-binding transcriptional regulator YdaS (Cro superfamily)
LLLLTDYNNRCIPDDMAANPIPLREKALKAAAEHIGGQTALAEALTRELGSPVSQQWVWSIIHRSKQVPGEWCLALERVTGGVFTRHMFRPDLYPAEVAA